MIPTIIKKTEKVGCRRLRLRALLVGQGINERLLPLFKKCGYDVFLAKGGSQVERALRQAERFDLLCIDIDPANQRRFEQIGHFRDGNPQGLVVTITKDNQKWLEAKARAMRVNYHLISPCSAEEMASLLRHFAMRIHQDKEGAS